MTCLRIGNVADKPVDLRRLSIWLKPEDLVQLIRIGLEHPDIRYEIFYGASDNARGWWDNSAAFRYGYRPQGRAEDYRAEALAAQAKLPPDPVGDWYQGGPFCSDEFDGGIERARCEVACRTSVCEAGAKIRDPEAASTVPVAPGPRVSCGVCCSRPGHDNWDYKLRPSNSVTLSAAMSTSSRQRTLTATISPPFGDVAARECRPRRIARRTDDGWSSCRTGSP